MLWHLWLVNGLFPIAHSPVWFRALLDPRIHHREAKLRIECVNEWLDTMSTLPSLISCELYLCASPPDITNARNVCKIWSERLYYSCYLGSVRRLPNSGSSNTLCAKLAYCQIVWRPCSVALFHFMQSNDRSYVPLKLLIKTLSTSTPSTTQLLSFLKPVTFPLQAHSFHTQICSKSFALATYYIRR